MLIQPQSPGYIYILSNPDMPGILKVGFTQNKPEQRAIELTTTGVPKRFEVEYYAKVDDVVSAEKKAHQRLSNFHHSKEFFKVDIGIAIYCIETISLPIEKAFSKRINDEKTQEYKKLKEKADREAISREILEDRKENEKRIKSLTIRSELLEWIEQKKIDNQIPQKNNSSHSNIQTHIHYQHPLITTYDQSKVVLPSDLANMERRTKKLEAELMERAKATERLKQESERLRQELLKHQSKPKLFKKIFNKIFI